MQLLLLQNVPHVGRRLDVVSVSDGYAVNNLIPQRLAVKADSSEAMRLLSDKEKLQSERAASVEERKGVLSDLVGKSVSITRPTNEKGSLFAALDVATIASAIEAAHGQTIATDEMKLTGEIKELGDFTVGLVLEGETLGKISLKVEGE